MKTKRITSALAVVLVISITGMGFLISCGESDTQTDDMDSSEVGEEPQATVRNNTEDTTQQQDQTEEIFESSLDGTNQVPEVETEASGFITVVLDEDSIHVKGEFSDLRAEYLASHIHIGAEEENGDPVQPLDPELEEDKMSGTWNETFKVDEDFVAALKGDSLYVNIHSEEYKEGEIRGQLTTRDAEKGKKTNNK